MSYGQDINSGRNASSQPAVVSVDTIVKNNIPVISSSYSDNPVKDVIHADDVIIQGFLAVGDVVDGESFGMNSILLRRNNLRVLFDDNSSTAGFPANDWVIEINDDFNGGTNHFAIQDATALTTPFKIIAGAKSNSLYIKNNGFVGFGTDAPVVSTHVKYNNTPTLRLEQDNSAGWAAQTWDIAGNEANFFIRDVTNSSYLPFRIKPNTPSNTLYLNSNGVGIGNSSPQAKLHVSGNAMIDSYLIINASTTPTSPILGELYVDDTDSTLRYYDGTQWKLAVSDNQDLVDATLVGTILEIEIEDGAPVSVDLSPILADLETRVAALEAQISSSKDVAINSAKMFQNYPNPFVSETSIPLEIPYEINKAEIIIYDLKGNVVSSDLVSERGKCSYKVLGTDIATGTYFYVLKLDGRELESKIMIKVDK